MQLGDQSLYYALIQKEHFPHPRGLNGGCLRQAQSLRLGQNRSFALASELPPCCFRLALLWVSAFIAGWHRAPSWPYIPISLSRGHVLTGPLNLKDRYEIEIDFASPSFFRGDLLHIRHRQDAMDPVQRWTSCSALARTNSLYRARWVR